MEDIIIDSYAWIEYFNGSKKGEELKSLFKMAKLAFYTVECCLAEIKTWCLRENNDFQKIFQAIKANSKILAIFTEDWLEAAEERFKQRKRKNIGMIDAILIVKQKQLNGRIITGDKHFKGLANIIFIGD